MWNRGEKHVVNLTSRNCGGSGRMTSGTKNATRSTLSFRSCFIQLDAKSSYSRAKNVPEGDTTKRSAETREDSRGNFLRPKTLHPQTAVLGAGHNFNSALLITRSTFTQTCLPNNLPSPWPSYPQFSQRSRAHISLGKDPNRSTPKANKKQRLCLCFLSAMQAFCLS